MFPNRSYSQVLGLGCMGGTALLFWGTQFSPQQALEWVTQLCPSDPMRLEPVGLPIAPSLPAFLVMGVRQGRGDEPSGGPPPCSQAADSGPPSWGRTKKHRPLLTPGVHSGTPATLGLRSLSSFPARGSVLARLARTVWQEQSRQPGIRRGTQVSIPRAPCNSVAPGASRQNGLA